MKKKKRKLHTVRKIVFGVLLIILSGVIFVGVKVLSLDAWHEFDPNKILGADESLIIYDSDMQEISTLYIRENRISIPLSDVPLIVQKAFISAEDARFYEHIGIDFIRIVGAAIEDIKSGGYVQGASTITQQLIKLSHLTGEKTMQRKAEEAVLAYLMEKQFTKDEILEMYLNYVYFGGGFYGIEAASRGYFGIHASELSAAQGAVLAGILKSPSAYAPHLNYDKSMKRHKTVLSLMHDYGYLSDSEYNEALSEEIVLDMKSASARSYYIDYAIESACETLNITTDELMRGGYRVYTALDCEIQGICDDIYANEEFFPEQNVQSAIAVVDTDTGLIDAMIGGRGEYNAMAYNRASQIQRQPGSVIKPIIVYAPAIEYYGYTAATVINDAPRSFGNYTPKNSGEKYYGNVTLRRAITGSLNIPAVTVLDDIGVENGKRFAKKVGIKFDDKDMSLSLALGGFTYGVSPLQVANAYGALCDGMYTESSAIISITDKNGEVLYTHNIKKQRVMSDANAYILTNMLCSVAKDGTGHRLADLGFDVACKTGTVSVNDTSNRDAWIAAYTDELSVAVWMGYDSANDGTMQSSVTGGSYPALIVKELLSKVYAIDKPFFERPDGIVRVRLDSHSVEQDAISTLATPLTPADSSYYEYFAVGSEPTESSAYWAVPTAPLDFACTSCENDSATFEFTIENTNTVYCLYRQCGEKEELLKEFSGEKGEKASYTDSPLPKGKSIKYFIRPVHKELELDGTKVTGADSRIIEIIRSN